MVCITFQMKHALLCLPAWLLVSMLTPTYLGKESSSYLFLYLPACLVAWPQSLCCCCPPLFSLQLLLLPLLLGPSVWSLVLSNTLYALAFSVYFYITHLGYRCENRKPPPMEIATKSTCRSGGARAKGFPAGGGVW